MRYPLAPNPVFWTLQGEGHLRGFQMAFVRLGGCSVGCPQCDTNYRVDTRATAEEIVEQVAAVIPNGDRDGWVWITGGEPTDHDLLPLLRALKQRGYSTAVATSGVRRLIPPVDWISVSPHSADAEQFQQRYGSEVKIVEGLNGLSLDEWYEKWPDDQTDFMYRYVQPMGTQLGEDPASLRRCLDWLKKHPRWALSRQDHRYWDVP